MVADSDKRGPHVVNLPSPRKPSTDSTSTSSSLDRQSRTPRFAEATSVHSPLQSRSVPFSEKSEFALTWPGHVSFGCINHVSKRESITMPKTPKSPPLKSAMRAPGTPGRSLANPFSPTFLEEQAVETKDFSTEKEQARDLRVKTRVRMAKFALRGVNFSCSLIIISMMSASLGIFNATKSLPAMNGFPPWASNTSAWPQHVVLACSCLSLAICIAVFVGYARGGHKRAEKVGVYYTLFAVAWFLFSLIMWAAAAGILQFTKSNSGNRDIWGWSCVQNRRSELFSSKVDYALICRLQSWGLVCMIIELIIETISIILYSIVFYRYWSKRKLHKSMDMRDKARSDLYLAQLRVQSAPNTPGFGPKSPAFSQYALSPRFPPNAYKSLGDTHEADTPFTPGGKGLVVPQSAFSPSQARFQLQAPPFKAKNATRASPKTDSLPLPTGLQPSSALPLAPSVSVHGPMADGEQQYDSVPIPGAYVGQAVKSPPPIRATSR